MPPLPAPSLCQDKGPAHATGQLPVGLRLLVSVNTELPKLKMGKLSVSNDLRHLKWHSWWVFCFSFCLFVCLSTPMITDRAYNLKVSRKLLLRILRFYQRIRKLLDIRVWMTSDPLGQLLFHSLHSLIRVTDSLPVGKPTRRKVLQPLNRAPLCTDSLEGQNWYRWLLGTVCVLLDGFASLNFFRSSFLTWVHIVYCPAPVHLESAHSAPSSRSSFPSVSVNETRSSLHPDSDLPIIRRFWSLENCFLDLCERATL